MAYYAIGVGGTGAKCIEALIHLCAAGLMPGSIGKELYVLFVDPDKSNGTLDRAEQTLQQYVNCRDFHLDSIDLFKTELSVASPDVWSPFGKDPRPKLEDFFSYSVMQTTLPSVAQLFDVLYSPQERRTPLDEGFRGCPAIGAAVLAGTIDLGTGEPWKTFRDKIALNAKNGYPAKILLFGSIFGGTGASGLPTIARLIENELTQGEIARNFQIGAVTMLPYFSFERIGDTEMRAQAENFLINTQAALKYYARQMYLDSFNVTYVLGDHVLTPLGPPPRSGRDPKGGKDQRNEPHFLEMYAALAALDFFNNDDARGVKMVARKEINTHTWGDVPFYDGERPFTARMDQLIRFAFAYDSTFYPALQNIAKCGKGYWAPWYVDFFKRSDTIELSRALDGELLKLRDYCRSFLLWAANVQATASQVEMRLFNHNAFTVKKEVGGKQTIVLKEPNEYDVQAFANLLHSQSTKKSNSLSDLWESMSEARSESYRDSGAGKFIAALYALCRPDTYPAQ